MYLQFQLQPRIYFLSEICFLLGIQQIVYWILGIQLFHKTLIESCIFATLELFMYKWEDGYFFTTYQQFCCNLLLLPIAIDLVHWIIPYMCIRILTFPIMIWLYELYVTEWLTCIFDKNPCWNYSGKDGSMYGGAICVNGHYYVRWMLLGCLAECWTLIN